MKLLAPATIALLMASAATAQATVIRPAVDGQRLAGLQYSNGAGVMRVAYDARVERAQRRLNELGYDAGPSDGLMGSRTRAAIRAYQRDQRLTVSGEIDRQTMRSLRNDGVESDRPQPDTAAPTTTASNKLVVDTQVELRRRGYPVPVVNGTLDSETRDAIMAFQKNENLLVTGEASDLLLERIKAIPVPSGTAGTPRDLVRDIQAELNTRGYTAGDADGVMDRAVRDAIRTYQADAGLTVDGEADAEVLASLRRPEPAAVEAEAVVLLDDDFNDGDYTRPVAWQVLQGSYRVDDGALRSSVVRSTSDGKTSPEDLARELLKGVLGQAVGVSTARGDEAAVISTRVALPNEFRIVAELSMSASENARLNLGPYQSNANTGYRLVLTKDGPQILAVLQGEEVRLVAQGKGESGLADGRMHKVEWLRDPTGWMTVEIDGRRVLETRDAGFSKPFDGIVVANGEGTWSIDRIHAIGPAN